jgi:antitoxin FitA
MRVSITIHDVPIEVWDELAAQAARAGQSLEAYLRAKFAALASSTAPDDLWDRIVERLAASGTHLPADAILEGRDSDRR